MAFSPAGFYTVAEELRLKAQADGPHLRTLISRAYYGALIEARNARNVSTQGKSGHSAVINAYDSGGAQDDAVRDALRNLRRLREVADYEPGKNLSANDANVALASCKRVLSIVGTLPQRPAAAQWSIINAPPAVPTKH